MAIAVYFHETRMTLDAFNESHRRLIALGTTGDAPPGRIHHSCFGNDDGLRVVQVWDSVESFQAFGATFVPVLAELGLDPGRPDIEELHRLEQSSASQTN